MILDLKVLLMLSEVKFFFFFIFEQVFQNKTIEIVYIRIYRRIKELHPRDQINP